MKNEIKLFIAKLFNRKYIDEFDYGFGDGEEYLFDETMNDWGRGGKDKARWGWRKRKDVIWHGTNCIDNIRIKYYSWALTPKEVNKLI